ncbi:MAG: DUF5908 family protein [Bacteroidota bacterium]
MPLEIREMIIRVTVTEQKPDVFDESVLDEKLETLKTKLVKECMEKLVLKMESLNER